MGVITLLPPALVNRIAAGEVVERPASVIKELVENAIDAGARRIGVEIRGAVEELAVRDDGCGMEADDVQLCFRRHATSKVRDAGDLERIQTLGFRGEALAAIAAVAEVELISRTAGAPRAHRVLVRGGAQVEAGPAGSGPGTTVRVRRLFFNAPARRHFLGSPAAERRACVVMAQGLALTRPQAAVEVRVDGQVRLATPGDGTARGAAAAVLGPEVAAQLLEVRDWRGPVEVSGLVGPPGLHRPGRDHLWLFVNGRWVDDRLLAAAAVRAYESALPSGRYPVGMLYVQLDPELVDVNVHPTKLHVRFRDEGAVFSAVLHGVRAALARAPVPAFERITLPAAAAESPPPAYQAPSGPLAGAGQAAPASLARAAEAAGAPSVAAGTLPGLPALQPRVLGQLLHTYVLAEAGGGLLVVDQHVAHERLIYEQLRRARLSRGEKTPSQSLLEPVPVTVSPATSEALARLAEWFEQVGLELEPFGERQWLVRARPAAGWRTAPEDPAALAELLESTVQALAAAVVPSGWEPPEAGGSGTPGPGPGGPGEGWLAPWEEAALKTLACRSAVKAGQALGLADMERLVAGLGQADHPYTCPHGRPILVRLSGDELNRRFARKPPAA